MKIAKIFITIMLVCSISMGAAPQLSNYRSVYNNNREKILIQEKIVQFGNNLKIVGIPVTDLYPEYYYKKSENRGNMIDEDALAKKLADEIMKRFQEMGLRPSDQNNGPKPDQTLSLARELVERRCATCHSGDRPDGGLSFLDEEGNLHLVDKNEKLTGVEIAWDMFSATLEEHMPKNGNKLKPEEVELLHNLAKYLTKEQKSK
jgi:hypothetical protein